MSPGWSVKFGALPSAMSSTLTLTFTSWPFTRRVTEVLLRAAVLVNPPARVTPWTTDIPSSYMNVPGFWTSPKTNTFFELYSFTRTETCGSRMKPARRHSRSLSAAPFPESPPRTTRWQSGNVTSPSRPSMYTPESSGSPYTRTSITSPGPSVEATGRRASSGAGSVVVPERWKQPESASACSATAAARRERREGMGEAVPYARAAGAVNEGPGARCGRRPAASVGEDEAQPRLVLRVVEAGRVRERRRPRAVRVRDGPAHPAADLGVERELGPEELGVIRAGDERVAAALPGAVEARRVLRAERVPPARHDP